MRSKVVVVGAEWTLLILPSSLILSNGILMIIYMKGLYVTETVSSEEQRAERRYKNHKGERKGPARQSKAQSRSSRTLFDF